MVDGPPLRVDTDPFVGRTLDGKYLVEELLGWGAMGSVYRARQVALDRTVALKVMSAELAKDPDFVARFHREAKTASRLWHPNTVSVTDFGEAADGLLYLVMELVPGRNLDEIIQQEFPLGDARIVSIVSQVLSAVAAAHDLGIIHRDLKPENLLVVRGVDDEGAPLDTVKVCDFGLARGLGVEVDEVRALAPEGIAFGPKLTSVGLVLGTPAYMSPEQAAGQVPEKRSDLYAVGAILFEMLTKEVPFERESVQEVVVAHLSDPVRDPRDLVPDCNRALAAICVRALAKEPNERPPTARAMRAAVQRALARPDETTFPSLDDARAPESTYPSVPILRADRASEIRSAKPGMRTTASETPTADAVGPRRRWPIALGVGVGVVAVASAGYMLARAAPRARAVDVVSAPASVVLPISASAAAPSMTPTTTPAPLAPTVVAVEPPRTRVPPQRALASTSSAARVDVPPAEPAPPPPSPTAEVQAAPASPPPAPVPAPSPSPVVAYVPDRASVSITVGEVSGTSRSTVAALVSHVTTTDCYQTTLRAIGRAEGGQGTMHLDIDEDGVVTAASVKLPPPLSAAAECFRSRMLRQRLGRPPDTGSASGELVIKLVP